MFASPLNFLLDSNVAYCSVHERDTVFGAIYHAYSNHKAGMNIYANPEYEQKELLKALKWAVATSQEPHPFCAILIYPRWKLGNYMNLMSHHNVKLIAKFQRDTFSFLAPDHWRTTDPDPQAKNAAKWQVMLLEVSNDRFDVAFAPYRQSAIKDIVAAAETDGAVISPHLDPAFHDAQVTYQVNPPEGYTKAKKTGKAQTPPLPVPTRTPALSPPYLKEEHALTHGKGTLIYTDGSEITEKVGAAYVIPETSVSVRMKVAGPQTVNRAEMTAELAVLQDVPKHQDISIFTDSKCSIQNVLKWIVEPAHFDDHKHENLLNEICTELAGRTGFSHIFKIPAHVGHPGNEAADKDAKSAAKATAGVPTRGPEENSQQTKISPTIAGDPITELKKQLRQVMFEWMKSKYAYKTQLHELWTTGNPDIDPKPSNIHWRLATPQYRSILQIIFRLRNGDQVNQRLLWLHAKDPSTVNPNCPLGCRRNGAPCIDSWIHMFLCSKSGAQGMSTSRHNAACRLILSYILGGNMGRWLILKNFGRTDDEPEEKTVPPWMLPPTNGSPAHNKPDFVIVVGWPRHKAPPTAPILAGTKSSEDADISIRLVLVEVKYANDMLTLEKHEQAHQLYSGPGRLTGYLEEAGWKVEHNFPTVVIGHRAVVSRKNLDGYQKMGITSKRHQSSLQDQLALSAAKWARDINALTRRKRAAHTARQPN